MTRLYIYLLCVTDQLCGGGWLLILILLYWPWSLGRNRSANELLTWLLCLVHKLLMMCGNVGRMGRWCHAASCRHWDTRMVVEGERFSFLGPWSCGGLLGLLVAVWVELIIDKLGVLGRGSWNRVVALWRRVVDWRWLRSHLLLA